MARPSSVGFAIAAALIVFSSSIAAQAPGPKPEVEKPAGKDFCHAGKKNSECGWFWGADFETPVEEEETAEQAPPPPVSPEQKKEEDKPKPPPFLIADPKERCKSAETWNPQCGWVDPGKDWAFMKMQEEKLAHQMVLNSNSPWSVKQYQLFVLWAVDRVSEVASVWSFNVSQDQDLNPNLRNVTNRQGLRWANAKSGMERKSFFELIKQDGGFLVYWTRSDCIYCSKMVNTIQRVSEQSGLEVWNASLDGKCEAKFKDRCLTAPGTLDSAARLQVKVVPDLMLYMPKENSWLRIASGVDSVEPILSRMKLYAQGVRAAAIQGTKSDIKDQAAVDFGREVNQIFSDTGMKRTNQP